METDDARLIRAYVDIGSTDALRELVERHVDFVYGVALRRGRDRHLAEDVTQAVFLVLARRASRLKSGVVLRGWLHTTTRYTVANALRADRRRQKHERQAAAMTPLIQPDSEQPVELQLLLDEALGSLRPGERAAVILRYWSGHTNDQVGHQMGTTAQAAAKRISRGLERMRAFFQERGVAADGPILEASLVAAAATGAPPGLATATCMVVETAGASTAAVTTMAKGTMMMLRLQMLKVVGASTAAAVATAIVVTLAAAQLPPDHEGEAATAVVRPAEDQQAAVAAAAPRFSATLDDGRVIELLGVSRHPSVGQPWWQADGSPAAAPYAKTRLRHSSVTDRHVELAVQVRGGDDDDAGELHWELAPYNNTSMGVTAVEDLAGNRIRGVTTACLEVPRGLGAITFRIGVVAPDWQRVATFDADGRLLTGSASEFFNGGVRADRDVTMLTIDVDRYVTNANRTRGVAILKDGHRVEPVNVNHDLMPDNVDRRRHRFPIAPG